MNPHQFLILLAGSAGHKAPPLIDIDGTLFVQGGVFLLLMLVLTKFVFRPYLQLKQEQEANTAGARERAEQESATADEQLASYEARVMDAKRQAAAGRAVQRAAGEERANAVLGDARQRAETKLATAREQLAKSAPAAQLALRTRADQLAAAVAAKILGRDV